jgi:hypothetical protein
MLRSGVGHAVSRGLLTRSQEEGLLDLSARDPVKAGDAVRAALGGPEGEFAGWLRQTFTVRRMAGEMPIIDAISNLLTPVLATTNYDRLLTHPFNPFISRTATWRDQVKLQLGLRDGTRVLHLHGIYDEPETVVFGRSDYDRLLRGEAYSAVLSALWLERTLLFVGCSFDGLTDPDFFRLLRLASETFRGTPFRHYALMRRGTFTTDDVRTFLNDWRIQIVDYGADYSDLPRFLDSLNPRLTEAHQQRAQIARRTLGTRGLDSFARAIGVQHLESDRQPHGQQPGVPRAPDSVEVAEALSVLPYEAPGATLAEQWTALRKTHELEANALGGLLTAGGHRGLATAVDEPPPWLDAAPPAAWELAGRILQSARAFDEAEAAFVRAAEHRTQRDAARQWARAAINARLRGDETRYAHLLARAIEHDSSDATVRSLQARDARDPATALQLLAGATPKDVAQEAGLLFARAEALLGVGDETAAAHVLDQAEELGHHSDAIREMRALVALVSEQRRMGRGEVPDRARLRESGELFSEISRASEGAGDHEEAIRIAMRAVTAFAAAGDYERAKEMLVAEAEKAGRAKNPVVKQEVANAASLLGAWDLVHAYAPGGHDPENRLLGAEALLRVEGGDRTLAYEELVDLLDTRGDVAVRAAFALLDAASEGVVEWHERAAEIVNARNTAALAVFTAAHQRNKGNLVEAEAALQEFADRLGPARLLVDLAVERRDQARALRLAEALVRRPDSEPQDRLRWASILALAGRVTDALQEYRNVATLPNVPDSVAGEAYRGAATTLTAQGRFDELAELAERWNAQLPDDPEAIWARVGALHRLGRGPEAAALWLDLRPAAGSEGQALFAGQLLASNGRTQAAIAYLAAESDRFGRPEELEAALIFAALRADETDVPSDLRARIRTSFETYPERFPGSSLIRAFKLDPDEPLKSFEEVLESLGSADQTERAMDAYETVRTGRGPTAALAAATRRTVGEVWLSLPALPLGYGEERLANLELDDATTALNLASAVWDIPAAFVIGGLPSRERERILAALPASLTSQSTIDEANEDAASLRKGRSSSVGLMDGDLRWWDLPPDLAERDAARASGTLRLLRQWAIRPDVLTERGTAFDELLSSDEENAMRSSIATMAVAEREQVPVYSDDRFIRLIARRAGLRVFGTVALIDAMANRGALSEDERLGIRATLHEHGAWGLSPKSAEFIAWAAAADFEPTRGLAQALHDHCAWASRRTGLYETLILPFLQEVHLRKPGRSREWIARCVDAGLVHRGTLTPNEHIRGLVILAVDPAATTSALSRAAVRELIRTLHTTSHWGIPGGVDHVEGALELLAVIVAKPEVDSISRRMIAIRLIERLPWSFLPTVLRVFGGVLRAGVTTHEPA